MRPVVIAASLASLVAPLAAHAAGETQIELTETATRTVAPDRMRATLRADIKGQSAREVQSELNKRISAALAKAKTIAAITAATGGYNVVSGNSYDAAPWQASETLMLTSADFPALLTLAGDLQGSGLQISGIEFFLAPETVKGAEPALTAEALQALKARAETVAKDLGLAVDHYGKIEIGNATTLGPIRPMPMTAAVQVPRFSPPVAEPGESYITLSVSAEVVLVPTR